MTSRCWWLTREWWTLFSVQFLLLLQITQMIPRLLPLWDLIVSGTSVCWVLGALYYSEQRKLKAAAVRNASKSVGKVFLNYLSLYCDVCYWRFIVKQFYPLCVSTFPTRPWVPSPSILVTPKWFQALRRARWVTVKHITSCFRAPIQPLVYLWK